MGLAKVVAETVKNFSKKTSIAGINQASHARSWWRRLCWLLLFLAFFTLTVQGIFQVVKDYLSHPFDTVTELNHETSVKFPAVTFCNMNRINCANMLTLRSELRNQVKELKESEDSAKFDVRTAREEFRSLDDVFSVTGCKNQICSSVQAAAEAALSDLVSGNDANANNVDNVTVTDQMVLASATSIGCGSSDLYCAYLLFLGDKVEDLQLEISEAEEEYECDDAKTCQFLAQMSKKMQQGPPQMQQSSLPTVCIGSVQQQDGGGQSPDQGVADDASIPNPLDQIISKRRKRKRRSVMLDQQPPPQPNQDDAQPKLRPTTDAENEAKFILTYLKLEESTRHRIGHRLESSTNVLGSETKGFLSACSYKGTDCTDESYWYSFTSPSFGNCISFNFKYNEANDSYYPRRASLTGVDNGLTVELFLDQDNYMLRRLSKKAGVRVVVHDAELSPLPDEYGIDLQPNTASSISVKMNNITRLEKPFKAECMQTWEESGYNVTTDMKYSLASCQRLCLQLDIISECGCFYPQLAQYRMPQSWTDEPCYVAVDAENANYTCFQTIMEEHDNEIRQCSCRAACSEIDYSTSVTSTTWPSNQYWDELAADVGFSTVDSSPGSDVQESIQQNFVQANVYFQTLNVQSLTQTEKYTFNTLLSSLGGALSLYLGMAVVLCFEVIELAADILINVMDHLGGRGRMTKKAH